MNGRPSPRLVAVASVLVLSACGTLGLHGPRRPGAVERGHATARRICAACHAIERGQTSPRDAAPAFASRDMQHLAGLEGRVETLTREGHHAMPPQHLTPAEVADLVAYIDSLKPPAEKTLDERPRELPVRPRP